METSLMYRQAVPEDIDQLVEVSLLAYGQHRYAIGDEHWLKMQTGMQREVLAGLMETGRCLVCADGKTIAGLVFLIPSGNASDIIPNDWACIRLLGVHPAYEGRGIGRRLTELCVEEARKDGEKVIALYTSEFQPAARHIYESMGFAVHSEMERRYDKRFWLYTLPLTSGAAEVTYHRATPADIQTLIDYRIEFHVSLWGPQPEETVEKLRDELAIYFPKAMEKQLYIGYFARAGEAIAGIGGLIVREQPGSFTNPTGRVGFLFNMYTVPAYRRRGICNRLLQLLMEDAREQGITAFELSATKQGEPIYLQNGFVRHPEPFYRKFVS